MNDVIRSNPVLLVPASSKPTLNGKASNKATPAEPLGEDSPNRMLSKVNLNGSLNSEPGELPIPKSPELLNRLSVSQSGLLNTPLSSGNTGLPVRPYQGRMTTKKRTAYIAEVLTSRPAEPRHK